MKHRNRYSDHLPRLNFDYYSDSGRKIPKVRFLDKWKQTKDRKWLYQYEDFWNDIDNNNRLGTYPKSKKQRKIERMVKHKLYFKIPFTEEDMVLINSVTCDAEYFINKQQENVSAMLDRDFINSRKTGKEKVEVIINAHGTVYIKKQNGKYR